MYCNHDGVLAVTCHRVGGCRACGGASGADHAGVAAAADSTDPARAGAAVAAPLPALPGATGSQPGAVLPDVVTHLMTSQTGTEKLCSDNHVQKS